MGHQSGQRLPGRCRPYRCGNGGICALASGCSTRVRLVRTSRVQVAAGQQLKLGENQPLFVGKYCQRWLRRERVQRNKGEIRQDPFHFSSIAMQVVVPIPYPHVTPYTAAYRYWITPTTSLLLKAKDKVSTTIDASCHCGAVHLAIDAPPETLTECNCSICRRYGALWAYYSPKQVRILPAKSSTDI